MTAIFNGDFTPMRRAEVESTTLKFPDGHELTTNTVETTGLNSIYIERSVEKKNQKVGRRTRTEGILGTETECNGPHPWRD